MSDQITSNSVQQADIIACCRYLADLADWPDFSARLGDLSGVFEANDKKVFFEKIIRVAREEGLQATLFRPSDNRLQDLVPLLPVLAEFSDGHYRIVSEVRVDDQQNEVTLTVIVPQMTGEDESRYYSLAEFQRVWSGGVLYFSKINTALVCFSIVAREHKIELTLERLRHDYNLGHEEIPHDTLLRMGRDLGLKGRMVSLDWNGLLNLKKAFPAIARFKNGRHIVVTGAVSPDSSSGSDDEEMIACYDPLAG